MVIASLQGLVTARNAQSIIVEVSGVGYLVHVADSGNYSIDQAVRIFTALIVREDAFTLFGFSSQEELKTFEALRTVSGVGPKSAMSILSSMGIQDIANAVSSGNDAAFKAVSGVGPKTAKLICVSLAGSFKDLTSANSTQTSRLHHSEIVDALTSLGWPERVARDAVAQVADQSPQLSEASELLKLALAKLGKAKSLGVSDE